MHRHAIVLAALACAAAQAQQSVADLMKTPECLEARTDLEAALSPGGPLHRLAAAREQAGLKCLGQRPPPLPEGRFVPPPEPVAPIRLRPAQALAVPPTTTPAVPLPPVANPRPPVITSCDAAGCWDSDGRRYHQQGPALLGPSGVCTLQAGLLNCP